MMFDWKDFVIPTIFYKPTLQYLHALFKIIITHES